MSLIDKTKSINRRVNSYSLKHIAEKYTGRYISNGSLILAALYMGFDIKQFENTPNAVFNMSKRSVNLALPEEYNRKPNNPPIVRPSSNEKSDWLR